MIIVHHLENSRSQRVLWLLEELAVPYEIKNYQKGISEFMNLIYQKANYCIY